MKKNKNIKPEQGFTLLDVAIGLLILSLILVPLAQYYAAKAPKEKREKTYSHQANIQEALDQYFYQHNSYPCPADPTLTADNSNFGEPVINQAIATAGTAPPCTGTSVEMPDPGDGTQIMAGALPFKALKIPESYIYDAWGFKMTYAVSPELTRKNQNFDNDSAAAAAEIIVKRQMINNDLCQYDGSGNPRWDPSPGLQAVHWLLTSHGPEGVGAYTGNGILTQNCIINSSNKTKETENCDYITGDYTFLHSDCQESSKNNTDYFDDILTFSNGVSGKYWSTAPTNNANIIGHINRVGIHNTDPQTDLDVIGNILISEDSTDINKEGKLYTEEICDTNDENCFSPDLIAGSHAEMRCNDEGSNKPSNAMSGIGNSAAECGVTINIISGSCPDGHYLQGLNSNGSVICTP